MTFGTLVRHRRNACGLKMAALAAEVGLNAGSLSNIETNRRGCSKPLARRILRALGLATSFAREPVTVSRRRAS